MGPQIDMTGQKFGQFTVLGYSGRSQGGKHQWDCVCDCGKEMIVVGESLRSGNSKSCGCRRTKSLTARNKASATRDGISNTRTGRCWGAMMSRCYRKKDSAYASYGGAGITVCVFLRTSPASVISIIGERPGNLSIDRIENRSGYHCGNCKECKERGWKFNIRWATAKQQSRNQKTNRLISFNGETHCVAEWAEITGIDHGIINSRIRRGWKEDELLAPVGSIQKGRPLITIEGETKTPLEWSKVSGVKADTICHRIIRGWTGQKLLSTPGIHSRGAK